MRKRKATRSEIIERNGKIVKDYENGLSFEQLSEKYGLCVRTCYRALDEEQQAQRIAEEQDHANLVDKIVAEYQKNTRVATLPKSTVFPLGIAVPLLFRPESATKNSVTVASPAVNKNATMKSSRNTKTASTPKTSLRHTIIPCRVFTVLFGASVSRNVKEIESSAECCRGLFFL